MCYNSILFRHCLYKWRAQFHKTSPLQLLIASPGHPTLLTKQAQIKGSHGPSLSFHNLLRWPTELRKTISLLLLVNNKKYNSRMAKWKWLTRLGKGGGHRASRPSLGTPPSRHLVCPPTQKITRLFSGSMEVPLHRHGRLNHWPLMIVLKLYFPSLPRGWGIGLKTSTTEPHSWFLWSQVLAWNDGEAHQTSAHWHKLIYGWKMLIINNKRCASGLYHLGNYESSKSQGWRANKYFLLYHNITPPKRLSPQPLTLGTVHWRKAITQTLGGSLDTRSVWTLIPGDPQGHRGCPLAWGNRSARQ